MALLFIVKLTPGLIAVMRELFGMPLPVTHMPTARLPVFAVRTTVGLVTLLVVHKATEMALPCTTFPTVSLLVSEQAMVVVAFRVQLVAVLAAKFSLSCVFHVVPPSGDTWKD